MPAMGARLATAAAPRTRDGAALKCPDGPASRPPFRRAGGTRHAPSLGHQMPPAAQDLPAQDESE